MKNYHTELKISGFGVNAFLYLFGDNVLDLLVANSESSKPVPSIDVLNANGIHGDSICFGINVNDEPPEVLLTIDGAKTKLNGLADVRFLDEWDDEINELNKGKLLYGDENIFPLKGDIPESMHAIVQIEKCKFVDAVATFESSHIPSISELRLNLTDLDSESNFSAATYQLGLLEGMELNLRSISYDGHEYKFSIIGEDVRSEDFYLIERSLDGSFHIAENSNLILLR